MQILEFQWIYNLFSKIWKHFGIFCPTSETNSKFAINHLSINKLKQEVLLDQEALHLSTSEYEALLLFAENPGKVMDREIMVESLRGITWQSYDRSVDVLVSRLRHKLGDTTDKIRFIKTINIIPTRRPIK